MAEVIGSPERSGGIQLDGAGNIVKFVNSVREATRIDGTELVHHEIQVPSIYVIGDQSSGKSAILSSLIGIMLPSKPGTCTRCPLEIHIVPAAAAAAGAPVAGPFAELSYVLPTLPPQQKIKCFTYLDLQAHPQAVANAIEAAEDEVYATAMKEIQGAGGRAPRPELEQCIVRLSGDKWLADFKPRLRLVVQTSIPGPVTLIDLPGLHRPFDRVEVHGAVSKFVGDNIKGDNKIVLAVVGANTDVLELDHSLLLSREAAHKLIVVTKIDKCLQAAERSAMMANFLRAGSPFVLVCNAKPDAVTAVNGTSEYFAALRDHEQKLLAQFQQDASSLGPQGTGILAGRCGVPDLKARLNVMQARAAKEGLPTILQQLNDHLKQIGSALEKLPKPYDSPAGAQRRVLELTGKVFDQFADACTGRDKRTTTTGEYLFSHVHACLNSFADDKTYFVPGFFRLDKEFELIVETCAGRMASKGVITQLDKIMTEALTQRTLLGWSRLLEQKEHHHGAAHDAAFSVLDSVHESVARRFESIINNQLQYYEKLGAEVLKKVVEHLDKIKADVFRTIEAVVTSHLYVDEVLHGSSMFLMFRQGMVDTMEEIITEVERIKVAPAKEAEPQVPEKLQGAFTGKLQQVQVPIGSFEFLCGTMGCEPSYVRDSMKSYYQRIRALNLAQSDRDIGKIAILDTMAALLCTWHGMTETVAKVIRLSYLDTNISAYMNAMRTDISAHLTARDVDHEALLEGDTKHIRDDLLRKRDRYSALHAEGTRLRDESAKESDETRAMLSAFSPAAPETPLSAAPRF